ncbi:MAG: VCBS repeat-containing protein [Planctomycetes bacterium]|nr:VCBS repeat-containing protein [Planctomycetota bacterium]
MRSSVLFGVVVAFSASAQDLSAQGEPLYRGELLTIGANPSPIASSGSAMGDVDHDGRLDLVTASYTSMALMVFFGDAVGGFTSKTQVPMPWAAVDCALGNMNLDAHLDFLALSYGDIFLRYGDGHGGFSAAITLPTGLSAEAKLHLADLDGDGKLDIIAVGTPGLSIRLSIPGLNKPPKLVSLGTTTKDVAIADFDGDGDLDLVVVDWDGDAASVFLGIGLGAFTAASTYPVGHHPYAIAAADLDGDGALDLALANEGSDDVSLLRGDGAGGFAAWTTLSVDSTPRAIEIVDEDSDGALDLVVGCTLGRTVDVLRGDGHGSFVAKAVLRAGMSPNAIHAGDWNSDGRVDLLTTSSEAPAVCSLVRDDRGSLETTILQRLGAPAAATIAADFDGDLRPDLVSAHAATGDVRFAPSSTGPKFAPTRTFPVGFAPRLLAAADFDGDGALDIACAGPGVASVLLGDGTGNFSTTSTSTVNADPCELLVGDTNGDGRPDLIVAAATAGALDLLLGDGAGGFAPATQIVVGGPQGGAGLDYWDGDGLLDLVVSLTTQAEVRLLLGDGKGGFTSKESWPLNDPGDLALAHFDADDALDVAAVTDSRYVSIHVATAFGSHVWSKRVELSTSIDELESGDFDFDTRNDVAALDTTRGLVAVAFGDGIGGIPSARYFQTPLGANELTVGDFDVDGGLDLLVAIQSDAGAALLRSRGACHQRTYCEGKVSVDGCYPTIASSGTPSASATSGFTITCDGAVEQQPGALLYSLSGAAQIPFAGGVLCLLAPIHRTLYSNSGGVLPCEGSFSIDFNAFAAGMLGAGPRPELREPGTAVYAQWWGIDTDFPPPGDRQLSDALVFHVCP